MSLQASGLEARPKRTILTWSARPLDFVLTRKSVELVTIFCAALFFAYVFMAVKVVAEGKQAYHFGDFFALWTSAIVTHSGDAALNFDADALHTRQTALGMNPDGYNPFPYPPTFLLLLGPLGGLSLPLAFWVFMIPTFVAYLLAMYAGRWREWWWALGGCIAPATGITVISGQTGFLSGALMIGGLRLLPTRPALAGILFGLLTYKPQLGVLIPVALVAAGAWRAIFAAAGTLLVCIAVSSVVYGFNLWELWLRSVLEYATRFHPIVGYMPTIWANAIMLGAWRSAAWGLQLCVSIPVAIVVWRAFRHGPADRAAALMVVGTFLATPHAFNYDMPMLTLALICYFAKRLSEDAPFDLGEIIALLLAFTMPFVMLELKKINMPMSWVPLGLIFCLIAWPRGLKSKLAAPTLTLNDRLS
jgi:Glycosyltransferase family 87